MYELSWSKLLEEAVTRPGAITEAYSQFHAYSAGNMLLAYLQCVERGIQPGPINTYPGWKRLGRYVKKGERGLTLCMPVTVTSGKSARKETTREAYSPSDEPGSAKEYTRQLFLYRRNWFALSQTEGDPVRMLEIPHWSKERALENLEIREVEFSDLNGNALGYARGREISVSPLSPWPWKTMLHEISHVELAHTAESSFIEGERTPRNIKEAEAEGTALILLDALKLPGAEYSRGYIQSWLQGQKIPERSAARIFSAADRILKAGYESESESSPSSG